MTFLPIVDRELRIASRRRLTFWGRLCAAGFALLVFVGLQWIAEASHGVGFKAGVVQFAILKWMAFLFACSAGVFLTADALSEEKREGTLGLLFLTDLRGHDVVFGKLISHSVQAFYAVLAAFPILGLPMLVGGVSGAEFGHTMLIICNTLFLSLSVGLFISSISRDVLKTMNGALLVLLIVLIGLPLGDWCLSGFNPVKLKAILSNGSPGYVFVRTGAYPLREYWLCLGIQHGMAWTFLILSSFFTPRAWQDKAKKNNSVQSLISSLRYGSSGSRLRFRRRLLDRDPILWLALRDRWMPRFIWVVIFICLAVLGADLVYQQSWRPLEFAAYLQVPVGFALMLWVASQASRFFVDAVKTGALELVLVTPVGPWQIVRNQWAALWRTFLIPALILIAVNLAGTAFEIIQAHQSFPKNSYPQNYNWLGYQAVNGIVSAFKFLGNLAAAAWFGMWMGLITRKPSLAILKTLCFVIVLPAIAILFAQGMTMFAVTFAKGPFWISMVVAGGLSVAKNIFFIALARHKLRTGFREAVLNEARMPNAVGPPSSPPPFTPPPLMPVNMSSS